MEAVESSGVLDQRAPPRYGHGEEQGVEPRVVEPFADVAPRGEDEPGLVLRDTGELRCHLSTLARGHASLEHHHMVYKRPEAGRQVLQVVLALGEQDRRPPFLDCLDDVVQDQAVPVLVPSQGGVQSLDPLGRIERASDEGRVAHDQSVLERTSGRLTLGVDGEPDRTELHLEDRVEPVPPSRRRREAGQVASLHLGEDPLERDRGDVVALVDDHVAVARHDVVHSPLPDETLEHGDVEPTRRLALARTDLADRFRVEAEEHPELGYPLVEERLPMNEDEGAPATGGDQVGADHGLPDAWRCHEDAGVV
jgi:hypothetical protein